RGELPHDALPQFVLSAQGDAGRPGAGEPNRRADQEGTSGARAQGEGDRRLGQRPGDGGALRAEGGSAVGGGVAARPDRVCVGGLNDRAKLAAARLVSPGAKLTPAGGGQLERLVSQRPGASPRSRQAIRSHHFSTRSARSVFQRLGAPRRSSSKYVLPFQRFCSDQRPSSRRVLRTISIASARRWSRGAPAAWKWSRARRMS